MVTIEHIKATLFHLRSELHQSEWEEEEFEPSQNKIISYKLKLALDSLQQLFSQIATIEDMMAALPKFQDFFKQFWHDTPWYMALPSHPTLHFFCDIASLLAQERNKSMSEHDTPLGLIELVMPTIQTLSNNDNYPDLAPRWDPGTQQWKDVDIKRVMKTHILGRNLTYLIPLKIIFSLDNAEEPTLFNPYYNHEVHPRSDTDNLSILSEEELQRLQDYSSETQGFFDNFEEHQALLNEAENLLGYLSRLVKALKKNSITDNGSEFAAGERGYIAIFNFMQIYDALSPEQKQEIPEDVKKEIEFLREQASNKDKVGSTASCFNTRGEILGDLIAIEENKTILNNIVLRENEKSILTKIIYEQLCKCREKIVSGLDGSDSLFITKWGIEKIEDLHHLNAEIAPLVRDSPFAMNVITGFFESIDDLRTYIQTQPIEHLALFLHFFVEEIWQFILKDERPDMFSPDYDSDDEDNIDNIQYTAKLFCDLLHGLTVEKIKLCFKSSDFFQVFLEKLILYIECWGVFLSFLKKQDAEQKEFFIAINKDRCLSTLTHLTLLRKITENSIYEVLCLLHAPDYSVIFNMYDELLALDDLEFTDHIVIALNELDQNNSSLLYQWIEKNTAIFLRKINPQELCFLNFSQRDRLYQVLEPALMINIQSSEDVKNTLSWLNPDKKNRFYSHIKLKIKYLIKTGKDVANILQHLNLEQYKETIPIINDIPHLFESFQTIEYCLRNFEETEDIKFDRLLSDFYPIKSAEELATLLNFLTSPLSEERFSSFKFRLDIILRNAEDFSVLFNKLSFKKLQLFFNAYQEDLVNRSWSPDEMSALRQFISPETPLILSPALQKRLYTVVIDINFDTLCNFELLKELPLSARNRLIQDLGRHTLLNRIKSIKDFFGLLAYLNREGCYLAWEMLVDDLVGFIKCPEDILIIKRYIAESGENLPPGLSMLFNLLPSQENAWLNPKLLENPPILENSYKMIAGERESKVYSAQPAPEVPSTALPPHDVTQRNQLDVVLSFINTISTPRKPPIDYNSLEVEELRRWGEYPDFVFFTPVVRENEPARKRKKDEKDDSTEGCKKPKRF